MIPIPRDYDTARSFDGTGGPTLTPGGHICRIQGVRVEKSKTGKDMLVVAFDISEGSEFDGYYKARFERSSGFRKDAKWPGVFRVTLLNANGDTNGYFKGFIDALEDSNTGYNFKASKGDEQQMKGKLVGFNFGEEEYEYTDRQTGEIKIGTSCKPAYAISVARVREGVIPPAKKLLNNGNVNASAGGMRPVGQPDAQGFQEVEDDELPF
ncbi:MAG: hypothetical protein IJ893_02535 [Bacteroidales bacterium]|nr:hypothetical protein [Bacteroidales bacterium]